MDSINSSFCRKFSVLLHITPNVDESQSAARGFSQSPDDNRDDDLQYENNVIYHCGKRDILKRKYPHKGAFFRGSFFVARPAQKEENRLYIIILQRLRPTPRTGSGKQAGENRRVAKRWAEAIWTSENGIATFLARNTLFCCTLHRNNVSLQTFCQSLKCHEL
ncbi:hypothetical protein [Alistipes finegoldii]|uniref:hypothetical protein n=1 Tax=Alistipes finegoldii TaxID=214856 RepID=UPI0026751B0D|nr:hypothetical protein [Alistipes finegoldii]